MPISGTERCLRFLYHSVGGDVEMFEAGGAGGASAVGVHADEAAGLADVVVPALADGGFAGDAGRDFWREDAIAIGFVLLLEELPAGHADNAAGDALAGELLVGGDAERAFAAGADEDHARLAVGGVGEHVCALCEADGGGAVC